MKVRREKTQNTTGAGTDESGCYQQKTDSLSTAQISQEGSSKATHPTFRDAIDSLGILSAQCGSAGIRKRHKDIIYQYLCWAALWLCQYGVEDDFPTKKEAERLLKGLQSDTGDSGDVQSK